MLPTQRVTCEKSCEAHPRCRLFPPCHATHQVELSIPRVLLLSPAQQQQQLLPGAGQQPLLLLLLLCGASPAPQ
jgi:hypothetical protein